LSSLTRCLLLVTGSYDDIRAERDSGTGKRYKQARDLTEVNLIWVYLIYISLTHNAVRKHEKKLNVFSSEVSQFKTYHLSGNLTFSNLGILKSLKLRNLMGKIPRISLKLNNSKAFGLLCVNTYDI